MRLHKVLLLALFSLLLAFGRCDDAPASTTESSVSAANFDDQQLEQIKANSESHQFQAEVSRLMDILINSLYSNREIFLRELISNAADACDKIRYLSLTNPDLLGEGDQSKLEIHISFDKTKKQLIVRDSGVGMTKKQLIENLGIVAKSGTTEFLQAASSGSSDTLSLIGQFGVGFYSVYLVADRVTVVSKSNDDDQYIWESAADAVYSITKDPRGNTLGRGTAVILHLKEDADEFLDEKSLEKIIARYSEFINVPIYLQVPKTVTKEVEVEAEEAPVAEESSESEDVSVSEEEEAQEPEKKTKQVTETVNEWKRLNEVKSIWTRPSKDVTEKEYEDFYKALAKDEEAPLSHIHFTAEGEITFKSLLYIPKKAPAGLYDKFYEKMKGLKLYVRRVLISDEFDDFLPRYFNFIRGVVDSDDLPLNVNRETLAQSKVLKVMSKKITRKVLEMLTKLSEQSLELKNKDKEEEASEEAKDETPQEDLYEKFWVQYGKSIKLGVIDDRTNRAKLSKLLRFITNKSDGKFVSLDEYVEKMKEKQKVIYYITGESLEAVKKSPFLEKLNKLNYEVLYMVDPLDEYLVQSMTDFDGHQLQSVTKEGLKIDEEPKNRLKKLKEEFSDLTKWLKDVYGDKVEKVTVSNRIASSPCVLVTAQYGWSANMERIMRAQTFANVDEASYMQARKTMELNPYHPIVKELKAKIAQTPDDASLTDLANLMYDAALVTSGFQVRDVEDFSSRIYRVLANGLSVDPNAPVEEEPEGDDADETPVEESSEEESATEAVEVEADSHDEL